MQVQGTKFDALPKDAPKYVVDFIQSFRTLFFWLRRAINGNLGYGDGTYKDNILGTWGSVADTGLANTDFAVPHDLGVVPIGMHLMVPPAIGVINKGATPWTASNIYLRCTSANQAVTVFVLGSSVTPSS